jgi:Dienelactone hydrolase family
MERKKASEFPEALLELFDAYVHGKMSRRAFLESAERFAVGGMSAAALFETPCVLVIHENRGLNPYIEDVARRLAIADFIAFAPDGLQPERKRRRLAAVSSFRVAGACAISRLSPNRDPRQARAPGSPKTSSPGEIPANSANPSQEMLLSSEFRTATGGRLERRTST